MNFGEENLAEIEFDYVADTRNREEEPEHDTSHASAAFNFFHDPFVDQVEKLRHASKESNAAFLESTKQVDCVQSLEVHDSRPDRKW